MKRSLLHRGVLLASAVATSVGIVATAVPAHAIVPAGQVAVAIAGSDTTEKVMSAIAANSNFDNTSVTVGGSPTVVQTYNIPAFSSTGFLVDGDTVANGCGADVTWTKDPLAPAGNTAATKGISPFGSTAGRNYLVEETDGTGPSGAAGQDFACVDVARSSSPPRTNAGGPSNDSTSFKYVAYALDAVGWGTTSLKAPATLSRTQLAGIFDCTITDWATVGGVPGPIQRYYPQLGSGTRSFFSTDILGKPSNYAPPTAASAGGSCTTDAILGEENNGTVIADADIDKAILPYSAAVWSFQESNKINPTIDLRKNARMGALTMPTVTASAVAWNSIDFLYNLDTAGVVTEANVTLVTPATAYFGIRYVWNVLDSVGNRPGYQAAAALFSFDNTAGGTLGKMCQTSGSARNFARGAMISNGFAPLTATGGTAAANLAGSTCRKYVPAATTPGVPGN